MGNLKFLFYLLILYLIIIIMIPFTFFLVFKYMYSIKWWLWNFYFSVCHLVTLTEISCCSDFFFCNMWYTSASFHVSYFCCCLKLDILDNILKKLCLLPHPLPHTWALYFCYFFKYVCDYLDYFSVKFLFPSLLQCCSSDAKKLLIRAES